MNISIGILYGGKSLEASYSNKAAKNVWEILRKQFNNILMIPIDEDRKWILTLYEKEIHIVINLVYGCPGQEGTIQGLLELLDIPYIGSDIFASSLIKDKYLAKLISVNNGINTPEFIKITKNEYSNSNYYFDLVLKRNLFPCVIKPCRKGGLSIGINYCENDLDQFRHFIDEAFLYDDVILIEKYIEGHEYTSCAYEINNEIKVLPIIETIKKGRIWNYDEKRKGTRNVCIDHEINGIVLENIVRITKELFRIFGMRHYGYFDFVLSKENVIFFIEAGSVPGFTKKSNFPSTLEVAKKDISVFWKEMIEEELIKKI